MTTTRSTTRTVGWGVVGCGWVARDYVLPALAASSTADLVGVCDHDPAALSGLDAGVLATTDLDALLARDDLDVVYVATPNHAHAPVVRAVAARGLPVLCEKPLAHDVADARAAVAAVRRAGVLGATAFDQRFHPAHERMAALIADGALGTVTAVRIVYGCWLGPEWSPPGADRAVDNWRVDPARAGGGAMIDLAPHGLDLVGRLLGEDLDELVALRRRRVHAYTDPTADDGAVLTGRTPSGVLLSQHVSFDTRDALPRRRLEVVGTAAQLVAVDTMGQTPGGRLDLVDADTGRSTPVPFDAVAGPFARQLEAFGACAVTAPAVTDPAVTGPAATGPAAWPWPLERDLALHELLLAATAREDPSWR